MVLHHCGSYAASRFDRTQHGVIYSGFGGQKVNLGIDTAIDKNSIILVQVNWATLMNIKISRFSSHQQEWLDAIFAVRQNSTLAVQSSPFTIFSKFRPSPVTTMLSAYFAYPKLLTVLLALSVSRSLIIL